MSPGADSPEAGRRFKVLETLGRGGFGVVYRAEATSHGGFTKQVALKVLRKDVELHGGVAERLRDEARILGLLRHRAIVRVDGLIELENGWAIVMEYVPGVNVSTLVKTGCPPRAAAEIIGEVASALHAAWHDVNDVTGEPLHLVHRDIKPANIRVTAQGEVKVLDFGVARADFADREAETVSMLFGSLRYMAPERLDGIEGPASDVYALALVFAELITGERFDEPPKNPRRHEEWADGVMGHIKRAVADEPAGAAILVDLLTRCLAYEEDHRPSALELRRACRELVPRLPGPGLGEFAESTIPGLEARVAEARRQKGGDDVDSVLVEHGSQAMRTEVTGITRNRALVGGVMAGAGLASLAAGALAVVVLLVAVWIAFQSRPPEVAVDEGVAPTDEAEAPRQPKLVTRPRPKPAAPEPAPVEAPDVPAAAPVARPRPEPIPEPQTAGATLTLTGDLGSVQLLGTSSHRLAAGANQVPPGSYAVHAAFHGGDPVEVSRITVPDGTAVLHCSSMLYTCRIQ